VFKASVPHCVVIADIAVQPCAVKSKRSCTCLGNRCKQTFV